MNGVLTLVEKTALLKMVDILASVPTESVAHLAARATEMHVPAGEFLFREGDPNRGSYLFLEGLVEIRRQGALLSVQSSGMVFGELALGGQEAHTCTAVAIEATHLLNITPEDVTETMLEFPEVGHALVGLLSRRIQELTHRIADLEEIVERQHRTLAQAGIEGPAAADTRADMVPDPPR